MTSVGQEVAKRQDFYIFGGNVNWCSHYEKKYGDLFKK